MKVIKKEKVFKGFFDIAEYTLETSSNTFAKRLVMVRNNAVAGILYDTTKNLFYLTKQWRPGSESDMVEIVVGVVESTDPQEDLRREVEEELGYKVDHVEPIAECYMSPGGSTESITIYYCKVSQKIGTGGGLIEEDEEITLVSFSLEELLSHTFNDAKTIIAVDFVRSKFR